MRYWAGECELDEMDFQILPHVLRVYQAEKGCKCDYQPQIDFSKEFPDPWILAITDISVPSQHKIDGVQDEAEVVLSHKIKLC